jgi:hypothetical protein
MGPRLFFSLPWWIFTISIAYLLALAIDNKTKYLFGTIARVYSPCVILLAVFSVNTTLDPDQSVLEYTLMILSYYVIPVIITMEIVYPKNTGQVLCRRRNVEFLPKKSFFINTAFLAMYVSLHVFVSSKGQRLEFDVLGDGTQNVLMRTLFVWLLVMTFNAMIFLFTLYCDHDQKDVSARSFERNSNNLSGGIHMRDVEEMSSLNP